MFVFCKCTIYVNEYYFVVGTFQLSYVSKYIQILYSLHYTLKLKAKHWAELSAGWYFMFSNRMIMQICMYICMYINAHINFTMCMYICMYGCVHWRSRKQNYFSWFIFFIYLFIYVYTHFYTILCMHVSAYVCMHVFHT